MATTGGTSQQQLYTKPTGGNGQVSVLPPPTIPNWVPGAGQPTAEDLNKLTAPRITVPAANTTIPIVYGRDRVFGRPFFVAVDETLGFLYLGMSFCQGPIEQIESIIVDGVDVTAPKGLLSYAAKGAQIQSFTGAAGQAASTLLAAGAALTPSNPAYTDTLPGVAYIALKIPKDAAKGFPRVEAVIRGRRVYDPRKDSTNGGTGAHRLNNSATWEWSTNPTLCFADFASQLVNWPLWWNYVADNANANDVQLAASGGLVPGGVHKRRELGLTLSSPASAEQWAQGFRVYMGAYLVWEGGKLRIVPDRADVEPPYGLLLNSGKSASPYDFVSAPSVPGQKLGTGSFTISAQVRFDALGLDQAIAAQYNNASTAGFYFRLRTNNVLQIYAHDGTNFGSVASTVAIPALDGEMHEYSVEVDRTTNLVVFRVDGVQLGAVTNWPAAVTGSITGVGLLRMGGLSNGSNNLFGIIDEVRLWNRVLTAAERELYLINEVSPVPAELIAYYKFNSLTGNTARDDSANANHATLNGSPEWAEGAVSVVPAGVAYHFTADHLKAETIQLRHRSRRNYPNSILIEYTDCTASTGWRTERVQVDAPAVTAGLQARRTSQVSLPGIHLGPQAYRQAVERLNWFLCDLEGTFSVFDEGIKVQIGSVIALTHPMGLKGKLMRVLDAKTAQGRWDLTVQEYDPAAYSDEVISSPTLRDTNLGDPLSAPAVTGLTAVEELFQYSNGEYGSRVRITWTASNNPFLQNYVVEGYVNGAKVFQTTSLLNEAVTPPVEELVGNQPVTYVVRVAAQTSFAIGAFAQTQTLVQGKLAPPSDVPSLTLQQIKSDQVELKWGAATDIDISYYEVRRGSGPSLGNAGWASATPLERVKGLSWIATKQPLGQYTYYVKALDSVGNYSTNVVAETISFSEPPPIPQLNGFEVGGEVRLNWARPVGGDYVARFRVSYSLTENGAETLLDIVDTLTFVTRDVAEGTYWFHVRTIDDADRVTSTKRSKQIQVSSDQDAFLVDTHQFVAPTTLTNFVAYSLRLTDTKFWVTNMLGAFTSSPSSFSTYSGTPLANYHASGSAVWLSETKDFGLQLTGNWLLECDVETLGGTVTVALEVSTNNTTWESASNTGAGSISIKGVYRYARVRITTTGTSTALVKAPGVNLGVKVVPFEETGSNTTQTGAARRITLSQHYSAVKEITVTLTNNVDGCTHAIDNIQLGATGVNSYFDVYAFDRFGQQMARDFQWKFKGV